MADWMWILIVAAVVGAAVLVTYAVIKLSPTSPSPALDSADEATDEDAADEPGEEDRSGSTESDDDKASDTDTDDDEDATDDVTENNEAADDESDAEHKNS